MSLIKFEQRSFGDKTFRKMEFLKLTNLHTVRILDAPSYTTYVHWINRVPIKCLDDLLADTGTTADGCPICKQNKRIIAENPETFRKVSTYSRKAQTFYLNVLDRTPVKICPNCNHENTVVGNRFPAACESCNSLITDVSSAPVNKVKILSRGQTFGEDINSIYNRNVDDTGTVIPIYKYDIQIMVGSNKQAFPQELINNNDVVTVDPSELFDLESAPISLDGAEMLELQRGVALKDIFAARTASDDEAPVESLNDVEEGKIRSSVIKLLG